MADKALEIPSRRFGRYRVHSRLGSGGMAEVFVAEIIDERGDERSVALKLMRPDASRDAFAAEADLMGLIQHPNLVERLEVGEAYGRPFIAMEYLVGGDLSRLYETLKRDNQPVPPGMALHIGVEVLKALAHFHQLKTLSGRALELVHGDVTPSNILFAADGGVKLGDLGVANSQTGGLGAAQGLAVGKLHYLSPEQTRGDPLTLASNLFSLGIVLYELLAGYHPFHNGEGSPEQVLAAMASARWQAPEGMDRVLSLLLKRALAPDKKNRFRSAGEFAGDLTQYLLETDLYPGRVRLQAWVATSLGILL